MAHARHDAKVGAKVFFNGLGLSGALYDNELMTHVGSFFYVLLMRILLVIRLVGILRKRLWGDACSDGRVLSASAGDGSWCEQRTYGNSLMMVGCKS